MFLKSHMWILFLGLGMMLWASYEAKQIDKSNNFKIIRYYCWGLRKEIVFSRDASLMSQIRIDSRVDALDDTIIHAFFVEILFQDNSKIIIYRANSEKRCQAVQEELESAFNLKTPYKKLTYPRKYIFYGGLAISLLGFLFLKGWAKIPQERPVIHG